jgi:hypothetical protein
VSTLAASTPNTDKSRRGPGLHAHTTA